MSSTASAAAPFNVVLDNATLDERVSKLLIDGGDDRLHLDVHGVNKYYCAPCPPASTVVTRGSCTC
eukprot:IDg14731t1